MTRKDGDRKKFHWRSLVGITSEYSRGDRILAWSVLIWTLFNFSVLMVQLVWNLGFGIWSEDTWFKFWCYYQLPLSLLVGLITTIWFMWGSSRDLWRLFRSMRSGCRNMSEENDNGFISSDNVQTDKED